MNKALIVILAAVTLDAVGIGLIFPILPALLRDVAHTGEVATLLGMMLALYSAMQFLFSPVLGVLSDRYGRRPVLLVSLAGAAIDYLVMAFAPELWMLVIGRAIAGHHQRQHGGRDGLHHRHLGGGGAGQALRLFPRHVRHRLHHRAGARWPARRYLGAGAVHRRGGAQRRQLRAGALRPAGIAQGRAGAPSSISPSLNPFKPLGWALTFAALLPLMAIFVIMNFVGTDVRHDLGAVRRGHVRVERH